MAIDDDDAGTIAAETQPLKPAVIKPAVIKELAWASLYTKVMHKDIGVISTAIKKSQPTAAGPEMKKSAEKLRDQLKSANRTVTELSDHVGIRPAPSKPDPA
ncbi:MAG TPA: hypothetical protein VGY99_15660 [Candidatus Binataceae bacterium]|nr:hypothetical protein [Candidatus Binataceae bacterium]